MSHSYTFSFKNILSVIVTVIVTSLCLEFFIFKFMQNFDSNTVVIEKTNRVSTLKENYDMVMIGDSRAHQGYDAAQISKLLHEKTGKGISVYNMGAPGMQAPFMYTIFKKYLETHQAPKVVVMNISYYLLGGMQWMNDLYFVSYRPTYEEALSFFESQLIDTKWIAAKWYLKSRIPSWRASANLRLLLYVFIDWDRAKEVHQKTMEASAVSTDEDLKGYYSRHDETIQDQKQFSVNSSKSIHVGYSLYAKYFAQLFQLAKEKGIKVYIVQFPWPNWFQQQKDFPDTYEFYQQHILEMTKPFDNVVMLNNSLYYDESHFADPLHVNQKGADRLSVELSDIFSQQYPVF